MINEPLEATIAQLQESVLCGTCKSAKLMVWSTAELDESFGEQGPQYAVTTDDCVYAVHCDYFRRRVEAPNRLISCHAHQPIQAARSAPIGQRGKQ